MKWKPDRKKKKVIHRGISLVVVFAMLINELFFFGALEKVPFIGNLEDSVRNTVQAAEDPGNDSAYPHDATGYIEVELSDFTEYSKNCQIYSTYHQYDKIKIINTGDVSDVFYPGFAGLGTESKPFGGSIELQTNLSTTLNLDAPLFNYVYDSVIINNNNPLPLSRYYSNTSLDTNAPLLAKHVVLDTNKESTVTWNIDLRKPSDDGDHVLAGFGGFIGNIDYDSTADSGAEIAVAATMNTSEGDTGNVAITGTGDTGLVCGHMGKKTSVSFSITGNRGISSITSFGGDVGGLVGEMEADALCTINGSNYLAEGTVISTNSGYAGGLVGKNTGGDVAFNLPTSGETPVTAYPIEQNMTGTGGAGGVYGYYKPLTALVSTTVGEQTVDNRFDTSEYDIDCTLNCGSSGFAGGLFGVLDTNVDVTICGGATVASDCASSGGSGYGGLVGKYAADSILRTLTIDTVTSEPTLSGTSAYYGGGIGVIDGTNKSYVIFKDFSTNATRTGNLTFGGLAAYADNAFVDVNGATVTTSGYKGGGLIGSLDHGILRIDGIVNLTTATPAAPGGKEENKVGRIVGWRDDALVFTKSSCTLTKSAADVDDIGAWGQVIRFAADEETAVAATEGVPAYTKTVEKLGGTEVLSVNESTHDVIIDAPSSSYTTIGSVSDYAKTALCFQIDATKNNFLSFADTTKDYTSIVNENISMSASVTLTDTGFIGLTRDNDIGSDGVKCTYKAQFTGKPDSTVNTLTFGGETAYRHNYSGLFGIADGATIKDTKFAGSISIKAMEDEMYAGSAAASAKGAFAASGLDINTTINHSGAKKTAIGGVLGNATKEIGTITVSDITANAALTGSATDARLGGVVGRIDHATNSTDLTWSFLDIDITGSITNTSSVGSNKVGGLIAVISGGTGATSRKLNLSDIKADGFTINVKANSNGDVGGILGYYWASVNADFDQVQVGGTTASVINQNNNSATGVDFAGLVYNGTGYWTVKDANDLKIDGFSLNSENAGSFGMIVNKGWILNSNKDGIGTALYLELQNASAYSISSASFKKKSNAETDMTIPVFDELVAYTAYYTGSGASKVGYANGNADDLYILKNGQAVVSIQTGVADGGLTMDGSAASGTYTPFTTYGQQMNPYSRYYYNLDTMKTADSGASGLMTWGAKWYAHSSIQSSVSSNSWGSTIPNGTYNMQGYSWYPLDIDNANVTIDGTFTLYNSEFEGSEDYTAGGHAKKTSHYDSSASLHTTQHYLMQSALFLNVGGKLTVGNTAFTLKGSVPQINTGNKYSGALVMRTVKGSGSTDAATARVTIKNAVLDGIHIYNFNPNDANDYAPLLINNTDSYSTLTVNNVSVGSASSYKTNTAVTTDTNSNKKAATSLIGNVGADSTSKNVNISFTSVQLDGRKTNSSSDNTALDKLDSVYYTDVSIFTKATLLNKLSFDTGKATYTFRDDDDWGEISAENNNPKHMVTYGMELGYTDSDTTTQYPNEERWYLNTKPSKFVNPSSASDGTGTYTATFKSKYYPYVATGYDYSNHYYQIEVNHSGATFSGCGTYNDPYMLQNGSIFETFYNILSTSGNPGNAEVYIPLKADGEADLDATWHDPTYGDAAFNYKVASGSYEAGYYRDDIYASNTSGKKDKYLTTEEVRTYVSKAYYRVNPVDSNGTSITTITIDGNVFKGLGNTTDSFAWFRGVIVGDGTQKIEIKNGAPLIANSNGSVVKGVNIVVDCSDSNAERVSSGKFTLTMSSAAEYNGSNAYGAVMATVNGGDNIIDAVTVAFSNTTIELKGTYAQLIPVGGYVGAVVNGGVYFRNMESLSSGTEGISKNSSMVQSSVRSAGQSNLVAEENNMWLYVNPIIGRVVNGFAVNEAANYRPYEDGTRVYKGDTSDVIRYWDASEGAEVTTEPSSLSKTTMQNGNKHYSIADVKKSLGKLDTDGSDADVEIPNGQALFVMSLIINSGMSTKELGYSTGEEEYAMFRSEATYNNVNTNTSAASNSVDDYNTYASTDGSSIRGYLMNAYTTGSTTDTNIGGTTAKSVKLTATNSTYFLPDGFKGIGNIFQASDNYRMNVSTFDGNGNTVSQNTYYYYYPGYGGSTITTAFNIKLNGTNRDANFDRYYQPAYLNQNNEDGRGGLGLFNRINSGTTGSTFTNLSLTGLVNTDIIHYYSGVHIPYTTEYLKFAEANQSRILSAGLLVGCHVGKLTINSVALNNAYVFGCKNTGGLVGYYPNNDKLMITNTASGLGSDKIVVESGLIAGGLIGKKQQGEFEFDNSNSSGATCTLNITKVESLCTSMTDANKYNYGVGGIIGVCRGTNSSTALATLKNFTMGSKSQSDLNYVKCENANIYCGGIFGIMNRQYLDMDNCIINNMSVKSQLTAGGIVGHWATAGKNTTDETEYTSSITRTNLVCALDNAEISSTGAKKIDNGASIDDDDNMKYCSAGGIIGSAKEDMPQVTIDNCIVEGYVISGKKNSGGVVGIWGDDSTTAGGSDGKFNHNLILNNLSVLDCEIESDSSDGNSGGLVGKINNTGGTAAVRAYEFRLLGYNILAQDLILRGQYRGYICGETARDETKSIIKLAGFSRQYKLTEDSDMVAALVGHPFNSNTPYGTGGYVIFADYDNTASVTNPNKLFSNIETEGVNVQSVANGSTTTVTQYSVEGASDAVRVSITGVDADGEPEVTTSESSVVEGTTYSVTKIGYDRSLLDVAASGNQIATSADIDTERAALGFFWKENTGSFVHNTTHYKDNTTVLDENAFNNSQIWYLEKNTNDDNYKIYTIDSGTKKYICPETPTGLGVVLGTKDNADSFTVYCDSNKYFRFLSTTKTTSTDYYVLNRSGYGSGVRYDKNTSLQTRAQKPNWYFTLYYAYSENNFYKWNYGTVTENNGSITFTNGDASGSTPSTAERELYEAKFGSSTDKFLYIIKKTVKKNSYIQNENLQPYVTTNPKGLISTYNGTTYFLTSDGVSSPSYASSSFNNIVKDQRDGKNKAYTTVTTQLGLVANEEALETLKLEMSSSYVEYAGYVNTAAGGAIRNFPLLVAEDTNRVTLTRLINNYLDTLTNTNYNFASANSAVYEVGLYKCTYNPETHVFDVDNSSSMTANLKKTSVTAGDFFYMNADHVDNGDIPQFSLVDVRFKDPSGSGKIAYHLYVPVYVRKVLRFDFNAEIKSGTDYYGDAYTHIGAANYRKQGLFENLGNPVTIDFEYAYNRSAGEWKDAINGGDSVLTNYYKSLTLKNHNHNGWPGVTRMVLVDANDKGHYYYLNDPPTGDNTFISLYDFTDANGIRYKPAPLQNLMTVKVEQNDDGTLTPTAGNTETGATVKYNGINYRPITDEDTIENDDRYTVTEVKNLTSERYYLSIFTKKDDSDDNIYRYEISSQDTFNSTGHGVNYTTEDWTVENWRANKVEHTTILNLFMGNLYDNDLTLTVVPQKGIGSEVMASDNKHLGITMTANVALTDTAVTAEIYSNMSSFADKATIYQSFFMMYDMLDADGNSEVGINLEAEGLIGNKKYRYKGSAIRPEDFEASNPLDVASPNFSIYEKYVEVSNEQNIITELCKLSNEYAVTLQASFDMVYGPDELYLQFPTKDEGSLASVGSKVIGYSNISSTVEGAANSAESDKKTDITRYYTTNASEATLDYYVEQTPNAITGPYSYLGINSVDTGDDELFVDTFAIYDTHKLKNAGDYIELTLTLSKSGTYVKPTVGNPVHEGTAEIISDYITELKIYGKDDDSDGEPDVIFDQANNSASSATVVTTKNSTIYKVRIHKSKLKIQAQTEGIYYIPIQFKVYTGNTKFKTGGLQYSNYKVSLTAATYPAIDSPDNAYSKSSYDYDHLIYTNARVLSEVFDD
ncbi:hypothetical protein SAMN04487934_10534 [Eubacterium ruminantium]|nr:hypothetical protein SAMN04487934_10534 [Eubacterium ruminantium]